MDEVVFRMEQNLEAFQVENFSQGCKFSRNHPIEIQCDSYQSVHPYSSFSWPGEWYYVTNLSKRGNFLALSTWKLSHLVAFFFISVVSASIFLGSCNTDLLGCSLIISRTQSLIVSSIKQSHSRTPHKGSNGNGCWKWDENCSTGIGWGQKYGSEGKQIVLASFFWTFSQYPKLFSGSERSVFRWRA